MSFDQILKFEIKDSWRQHWQIYAWCSGIDEKQGEARWDFVVSFERNHSLKSLSRKDPGVRGFIIVNDCHEPTATEVLREYHRMVTDALVIAASSPPNERIVK